MFHINENYQKMPGSYLFAEIGRKVKEFSATNPEKEVIRLGIGDVTLPLVPAVVKEMSQAALDMGTPEGFKGYPDYEGYEFLRRAIKENDFDPRQVQVGLDEIFVNDGAKSDSADLGEIFSQDCKVAVCDPVYPVYVNSHALAGRAGDYLPERGEWSNLIYMPCTEANGFVPDLPKETPDLIYLCYPNNPTGGTITREALQRWVDYALKNGACILYDAAYEAYITDPSIPHSIYECEGAKACAIELRSFSKNAGFTGVRLGYTVVPKELKCGNVSLNTLWMKHQEFTFNGVSYPVQRAGAAVYSPDGKEQTAAQVAYYLKNAKAIKEGLEAAGYTVYGAKDSPYAWLKVPAGMTSWQFFDRLLNEAAVVGTPGSGFGPHGEGFFRLTGFGTYKNTLAAIERIQRM